MKLQLLLISLLIISCSNHNSDEQEDKSDKPLAQNPDSTCVQCDNSALSIPILSQDGGVGAVTTYGDVTNPTPSMGGACNYGSTNIMAFAAAHVHLIPGDKKGLWNGGRACGQCYKVKVGSLTGFKETIVRIVDKCPDDYCGIDLGGFAALELMKDKPGRYAGEWEAISCSESEHVSDGVPSIYVKEGSNSWWALIQVRNPISAVESIQWTRIKDKENGMLLWATEAENFYKVPDSLLLSSDTLVLRVLYWTKQIDTLKISGKDLGKEKQLWKLSAKKF